MFFLEKLIKDVNEYNEVKNTVVILKSLFNRTTVKMVNNPSYDDNIENHLSLIEKTISEII